MVAIADTSCDAATGLPWADEIVAAAGTCQYGFQARTVLGDGTAAADALVIMTDSKASAESLFDTLIAAGGPGGTAVAGLQSQSAPPGFESAFASLNKGASIEWLHWIGSVVILNRDVPATGQPIVVPDEPEPTPIGDVMSVPSPERLRNLNIMIVGDHEIARSWSQ